jgi:hypothetical protein
MRMLVIAASAAVFAFPSSALANHFPTGTGPGGVVNTENPDGFRNQGQCRSALAQGTNRQRKNPDERTPFRQDQKSSEFQRDILDRFECRQDGDNGPWRVFLAE